MIEIQKIREIADQYLVDSELFIVEIKCSPANEVEILIGSDTFVSIDKCMELSRKIDAEFDREIEDFELTVASSGIGQPLKVFRQYKKLIGKNVEIILKTGVKFVAELKNASKDSLTLVYTEKVAVEGKKRKQEVEREVEYQLEDIKSTIEYLDFK